MQSLWKRNMSHFTCGDSTFENSLSYVYWKPTVKTTLFAVWPFPACEDWFPQLQHEWRAQNMKPETVSTQWVKVDYKDKIKRNRPLGGDLNRHPSVDDHLPIENVLYSQATHTHTHSHAILQFSQPLKLLPKARLLLTSICLDKFIIQFPCLSHKNTHLCLLSCPPSPNMHTH